MTHTESPANHENTLPFGPCAGPAIMGDRSFFCQGSGFASLDPATPFHLNEIIMCGPCKSFRESQVIEINTLSILSDLERAA